VTRRCTIAFDFTYLHPIGSCSVAWASQSVAQKKAVAEAYAKVQGSDKQPGCAWKETPVSQQKPKATAGKRKATELDSSDSDGSMEPAARRPAPGPLTGTGSAPLPAPAKGKTSTGEQAANSGRQLSYAEVGAAYDRVVAGRPVKGRMLGWIPRHRSTLKTGPLMRVKEGGM
jgi:hypothetical protein